MRTRSLIILGFSILMVALAAKPKKSPRDVGKSATEDPQKEGNTTEKIQEPKSIDEVDGQEPKSIDEVDGNEVSKGLGSADKPTEGNKKNRKKAKENPKSSENSTDNAPSSTRKPKKSSKLEPVKKSSKKASKKELDDLISEDLNDILKDSSAEDEVEIPPPEQLTTESDPIELGKQIKNLTDRETRKELITELKRAYNENDGTLPGIFYRAAYASLINEKGAVKKAKEFWNKHLKEATEKVMNAGKDMADKANVGVGNALGNAAKIAEIDPLGIALREGESVFLTALSDAFNNLGKLTDFTYDTTKNTSHLIRAATFPVHFIPIASQVKNNVHDYIEEGADRGKYLTGSFAENGSKAFANAAKNAGRKADEKKELLRQFTSTRII